VTERWSLTGGLDLQMTGDHLCYRSAHWADSAFHPFGVDK